MLSLFALLASLLAWPEAPAAAPSWVPQEAFHDDWCDEANTSVRSDEAYYCEVRPVVFSPSGAYRVAAGRNGHVQVVGDSRSVASVQAKIQTRSQSPERARALADEVTIRTDGTLRYDAPPLKEASGGRRDFIAVSFRLAVPQDSDIDVQTFNGGIEIENVTGHIRFESLNGGVSLDGLGGDVEGTTTNGSLNILLAGQTWDGAGLDVTTTNGSVDLRLHPGFSAYLMTGTTNGRFDFDLPGLRTQVQRAVSVSKHSRLLTASLGTGGPPVRVVTTNGSIRVGPR